MDSLTHVVLGASIGEATLGNQIGRKAAFIGAIVNTLPDLDIVLTPFFDEFQKISLHRGYSHSILFCLLLGFILVLLFQKLKWTKQVPVRHLMIFTYWALFSHILLDAFTSFGTQLFLPFSDLRVSFDSINIIDPIYTIPILIGLSLTLNSSRTGRNSSFNLIGLGISTLYLLVTLGIKQHVNKEFIHELSDQDIFFESLLTVPVGFGDINWYGVAKSKDGLYIGRYSDLEHNHPKFEYFPTNEELLEGIDPQLVDRLKWFSQGYYTVAENEGKIRLYNMQCDMQGVRHYGEYRAPTAFYYEITPKEDGTYELASGMHKE